ncbi:hypothetical protein [Campylobacter sp. US33a]|uniref:hypothetical protein n=1 Tax=Campylobacter sp. US33a TaxID=2498120 RepID=UPI0010685345|nr:hypothetical protein [Campylobacter sp. US33a]TEY00937.1 hypothetical protein ELQ16_08560 [Campylobacter sp. US33a]
MPKLILVLILAKTFILANIFETLNDFAYSKSSNTQIQSQDVKLLTLYDKGQKCAQILVSKNEIIPFIFFDACKKFEKSDSFEQFLNSDFKELYFSDNKEISNAIKQIQATMQDIMLSYKLNRDIKGTMSKNPNLTFLEPFDFEKGGTLLYKVDNQACVLFKIFNNINGKKILQIQGMENLNKSCKLIINSPQFKSLSYNFRDFNSYILEQ